MLARFGHIEYYSGMTRDNLESLVERAHSDIEVRMARRSGGKQKKQLLRVSLAVGIWFVFLLLAAFEFDTFTAIVAGPAEARIERDLEHILSRAADSLGRYESLNGVLPPLLPNPAIRGLVRYERESDFSYTLTATISNVTMVKTSSRLHPFRLGAED